MSVAAKTGRCQRASLGSRIIRAKYIYLALLPGLMMICVFLVYPVIRAIFMSFTNWKLTNYDHYKFIGVDNYIKIFSDRTFWKSMRVLLVFVAWGFVSTMCWAMPMTYLVYKLGAGRIGKFFQRAYIIPMMVPGMVITLFWRFFYETNSGMLNTVLRMMGRADLTHVWLGEEPLAIFSLLFMNFPWIGGFGFLVILAGFQNVDVSLHEAANIDGASAMTVFARIDVPLIIPQLKLLIILGMIGSVQEYSRQMIMTNGGPNYSTTTPGLLMYNSAFNYGKYGYGSAIGVILFVIIMAFTIFAQKRIRGVD